MALKKPPELVSFLNKWNFDVFTFRVYIGDVVENAIDWSLSWINAAWEWAVVAYNWAKAAWDKAISEAAAVAKSVGKDIKKIFDQIDAWGSELADWWRTKKDDVKDWIGVARQFALDRIADVRTTAESVSASWSNFKRLTLPGLASNLDVTDAIKGFQRTWRDLFTFWENWRDSIVKFFEDPLQWLYDRVDEFFERFW